MTVTTLSLFILGFFILIKGAQALVAGASSLAKRLGMSEWVIGTLIVGVGTSLPELSINIAALFNGSDVGVHAILGSNTFNILFILGLVAIISPIKIRPRWVKVDIPVLILSVLLVGVLWLLPIGMTEFGISRIEGGLLLALFIWWVSRTLEHHEQDEEDSVPDQKVFTYFASFLLLLFGGIGVFFGGEWVVGGAEAIARAFGVREAVIGLFLVGAGTSLPEVFVSVVAALRRRPGIAVGNVLGSNIFDILGIFGVLGLIAPVHIASSAFIDLGVTLGASVLLFLLAYNRGWYRIRRFAGLSMILLYVAYIVLSL